MSDYTEAQAQADADALIARLAAEPGLRDALVADPRSTLIDAGLRPETVAEIEEALAGSEVEGFVRSPGRVGLPTVTAQTVGGTVMGTSITYGRVIAVSGTSVITPGTAVVPDAQGRG